MYIVKLEYKIFMKRINIFLLILIYEYYDSRVKGIIAEKPLSITLLFDFLLLIAPLLTVFDPHFMTQFRKQFPQVSSKLGR